MNKLIYGKWYLAFAVMLLLRVPISAQSPDAGQDSNLDKQTKSEVIHSLAQDVRAAYVLPDEGEKIAKMLEAREERGEYNSIASAKAFADTLNKQMFEVAHDMHLRVIYSARAIPPMPPASPANEPRQLNPRVLLQMAKNNYAFEEVKRLDGNIGYLKVDAFLDAERGGPTVSGAMAFLANTDALIIDLRANGGGNPDMVTLLASYLFGGDHPVHLSDVEFRQEGTRDYSLTQAWVLPYVPGPRYVNKDVYILTSHYTFSAAEDFAYDLQVLKRATIVGEVTAGGANPGRGMRLNEHFQIAMPTGRAINPLTKTNWEGVGVKPDIEVSKEDSLRVAEKRILERFINNTTDQQELGTLKSVLNNLEKPAEPSRQ